MKLFSFTALFGMVGSAALPLGSLNRLPLHVMGLSPNSRSKSIPSSVSVKTHSSDAVTEDDAEKELCISTPSSNKARGEFPSLATVFDCRGGHSMSPVEDHLKSSTLPVNIFGLELSLFGLKLLLQIGLTLLNVGCWWLPMRTKSFSQNDNLLAMANTFSAGIFLMLAFTHLIPHSLHTLEDADIKPMFALQATVVGYMIIFAIENLLFDSHSLMHDVMEDGTTLNSSSLSDTQQTSKKGKEKEPSSIDSTEKKSARQSSDGDNAVRTRSRSNSSVSQHSAIVLLLAMAVHSLFETVALGMAPDRTSAVIMATSVALHQPAESLALLVAFLSTNMDRNIIMRWLGLFSVVGPFGVFLGRFIQAWASPLIEGVLVAMTAGTFLYVGTTEIIPEAFADSIPYNEKWKRFLALVGGIGSIMLLGGDDHDHSHHH